MGKTRIEWCDSTWNPISGCTPVSEACQNCYAERFARRLAGRSGYPDDEPFRLTLHPERLKDPLKWEKPQEDPVRLLDGVEYNGVPGAGA